MLKELMLVGVNRSYDTLPYETAKPLSENEIEEMCNKLTAYAIDNAKSFDEINQIKQLNLSKMLSWKILSV